MSLTPNQVEHFLSNYNFGEAVEGIQDPMFLGVIAAGMEANLFVLNRDSDMYDLITSIVEDYWEEYAEWLAASGVDVPE